ncbi:restriction endonuclease subunit S domain-containing protein [Spirosoma pulveris]
MDPTYQKVVTEFTSSKYSSKLLRDVVLINPVTKFEGLRDKDEVTFVPMGNVSEDALVDTSVSRKIADCKGYTLFSENDLLIAKITPCFLHAFFYGEFFRRNAKMMFGGSAGHQRANGILKKTPFARPINFCAGRYCGRNYEQTTASSSSTPAGVTGICHS